MLEAGEGGEGVRDRHRQHKTQPHTKRHDRNSSGTCCCPLLHRWHRSIHAASHRSLPGNMLASGVRGTPRPGEGQHGKPRVEWGGNGPKGLPRDALNDTELVGKMTDRAALITYYIHTRLTCVSHCKPRRHSPTVPQQGEGAQAALETYCIIRLRRTHWMVDIRKVYIPFSVAYIHT